MFITDPTNIDYLITDVRLRIGDTESVRFSDTLVRTSLISSVKQLQRRWKNRYLVFTDTTLATAPEGIIVPAGFDYAALVDGYGIIPTGLSINDVFRNPYHTFLDPSASPISQEDEFPIVLMAAIVLRSSYLTSSAETFQSWSDGEYTFSNISAQKTLGTLLDGDILMLDAYFKKRLVAPLRADFPVPYA